MNTPQTLYSQTPFQIFIKNFLAGFAKGLGTVTLYFITIFLSYQYLIKPKLGNITKFLDLYKTSMESIKQLQTVPSQTKQPNLDINDLLDQFQLLQPPQ